MTSVTGSSLQRQPSKPLDPVATIVRHWFKIAVFGSALFIIILPVLLLLKSPYYVATGKLRISPVVPALITRSDELSITGYYTSYVQTQVDKIKNPEIIEAAFEKLPPNMRRIHAPGGMPVARAAEIIRRSLIVIQVAGTHLISISIGGTKPEGLSEMVNAVMDAYMARLRDEEEGRDNRRVMYLQKDKDAREEEVSRLSQMLQTLSREADTSTFSEMHNVHDPALVQLQHAYVRAYERRVEKENALKELRTEVETLKQISLDPMVGEMVENNDALNQIDFYTYQTLQQMRSSIDGVSKGNPDKKYIDARMKGMQDYLEKMREDIRLRSHSVIYGKRDVEQQQRIIRAETEFREAQQEEREIIAERDRVQKLKVDTSQAILKGQETVARLEHLRSMLNRIDERINDLKLETMAPGRIFLESAARKPELPDSESSKKALLLALLLSFGAVAGACIAFDIMDVRVRTRKDVAAAVGAPPSWPVSDYLRHARPGVAFHRVTRDDPHNTIAMAINSLAVHLDKESRDHGGRVAVFTGVEKCSGVTGIALNTAYALSLMCGKILVIDANQLHPQIAALTGIDGEPDVRALLAGAAGIEDCIVPAGDRGFDVLPLHPAAQAAELAPLARAALPGILQELRRRYSFILIDAPPLLRHDLTEYLLVHTDMAVLVIQGDRSPYGSTHMAADIILKLQVPALAPVLNWGAPRQRMRGEVLIADILQRVEREVREVPGRLAQASAYLEHIRKRRS
jgi:polysaccharide biosynthesis transport protein